MSDIQFLGEDDFLPVMEKENEEWKNEHVEHDYFSSFDGRKISYYHTRPENPKATIVIVHGMGEFFGKYREYMWYLYRSDFEVFMIEHRGHGYSEGKAPEMDVIYIDSYNTYVKDLYCFIQQEVLPKSENRRLFMMAHSMGGCIGTLFLEQHPEVFSAAILSSPMLKMKGANYSPIVVELISFYALISGKRKKLAPGQKHFTPTPKFEGCSALSRVRFDYQLNQRIADPNYRMSAASFGWAMASLRATRKVIKNAVKIHIPVTVMTAGCDHLIDPEGYEKFREKVPQAVFHPYETSRHEIFNADDVSRKAYFADVIDTFSSYLT